MIHAPRPNSRMLYCGKSKDDCYAESFRLEDGATGTVYVDTLGETRAKLIDLVLCSRCLSARAPDGLTALYDHEPIDERTLAC